MDISGISIPGLPRELLGPTGLVFRHPDDPNAFATELVSTFDIGGRHVNVPMLVPGQYGIDKLLRGERPETLQVRRALDWVRRQPEWPTYNSQEEALAAVHERHGRLEQELMPLIRSHFESEDSGTH